MFKNKHLQVKMMDDTIGDVPGRFLVDLDSVLENHLSSVVGGVVTIMVARKVLNTACELVLIKAGKSWT